MRDAAVRPGAPPFCPNPGCRFHADPRGWHWKKDSFHTRRCPPQRVQRYRCLHCQRSFSDQTFALTYWLKYPGLLPALFWRLLGCSGFRQIAREFALAPSTVAGQAARLGRHCLLFHLTHRPRGPLAEPIAVDGFESFEWSQYYPLHFLLAAGTRSHFLYAFTDAELRRKGRMTPRQRRHRATLERRFGRPDPKALERELAELLRLLPPAAAPLVLHSDDHPAYPRALRHAGLGPVLHRVTPGRSPRTAHNPLFPVNLLDLLIRHSGANHKRETIAFSKRRQSAAERLAILLVWRNYLKYFSERKRDATPAMRLGLLARPLTVAELLQARLFPSRISLPPRLAAYYWGLSRTRALPRQRRHRCRYAA